MAAEKKTCCAPMMPPCDRPSRTKGLCHAHYERERRQMPVGVPLKAKGRPGVVLCNGITVDTACAAEVAAEAARSGETEYQVVRRWLEEAAAATRKAWERLGPGANVRPPS